ncbi:MAG TPA: hypothetical protein VE819_04490 [Steroidobacteraceae bacterium]|nr:hypothetical protein [Steroidobacteraceae bacterium]
MACQSCRHGQEVAPSAVGEPSDHLDGVRVPGLRERCLELQHPEGLARAQQRELPGRHLPLEKDPDLRAAQALVEAHRRLSEVRGAFTA